MHCNIDVRKERISAYNARKKGIESMDKWAELRTAYQVARLGTVSAAANALGFHRATVNRHIDVLEDEIGARIFIRHARGYALTELGEDVLRVARKTEELIDDLAGRIKGGKAALNGELKLTILAGFAELLMKPISDFRAKNPNCIVNLDASENLAKLEYGEAHIALRAGPKPDHPDYVVSNFAQISFNLYAHDSYIQKFGMPKDASDFGGHQFVLPPRFGGNLSVRQWVENIVRPDMIALSSQNVDVNFKAVFAGVGIGIIEDHKAKRYGGFHRVLTTNEEWSVPIWLVTHVDLHRTEKVQAMLRSIKSARKEE
jgi:DNA-binding transcriptional LysR family regulator